jgi:hypothetical protein
MSRDDHEARRGVKTRGEAVERISMKGANALLDLGDLGLEQHYLGPSRYRGDLALSNERRNAVAVFRPPIAASFNRALPGCLELSRLQGAGFGDRPEKTLSVFLSACVRWLRRFKPACPCVISYTDVDASNTITGRPHSGGVYRAANFVDCGNAPASEPHWIDVETNRRINRQSVYRLLGTAAKAAVAEARPGWSYVAGSPKRLFIYPMALTVPDALERLATLPRSARTRPFPFAVVPPYRPWE